jgi:hypothetical protein
MIDRKETEFKTAVYEIIQDSLNALQYGTYYTVKQIMPDHLWISLNKPDRNNIGRVVAELVLQNKLPLIFVGKNSANHCIYQRA